jgi:hypothetical protein
MTPHTPWSDHLIARRKRPRLALFRYNAGLNRTWEDIAAEFDYVSGASAERSVRKFAKREGLQVRCAAEATRSKSAETRRRSSVHWRNPTKSHARALELWNEGSTWRAIAKACGYPNAAAAMMAVRRFAAHHGLPIRFGNPS